MTQVERFQFECMDTPTLANEMRLVKSEQRHYADIKRMTKDDHSRRREHTDAKNRWRQAKRRYNELEKIMRSRQLSLF